VLDQEFWRAQLLRGSLLPYLWDLGGLDKPAGPKGQHGDHTPASGWDWRTLAWKLSRADAILENRDARMASVPMGLRNRYRVWKIVSGVVP